MSQEDEVRRNYEAFKKVLPELLRENSNKYALLRDEQVVAVYDTMLGAVITAEKMFGDDRWSIQRITNRPINLGLRSRALHIG